MKKYLHKLSWLHLPNSWSLRADYNLIIIKTQVLLPQAVVTLAVLCKPFGLLVPTFFIIIFAFQPFDLERTWWMLFVRTKFE
jgi:hypothetical protein